jgi:hypothetical protein
MLPDSVITIRPATEADAETLRAIAIRDSRHPLTGRILVAEEDGVLVAALSLDERRAIADPFEPSATVLSLLDARARALRAQGPRRSLREWLLAPLRTRSGDHALPSLSA